MFPPIYESFVAPTPTLRVDLMVSVRRGEIMNDPRHPAGIRTISRDELSAKLGGGDRLRLIMALNEWAFRAKHIPGSEHFNTPDELYASLAPDDDVVVYCTSIDCHSSIALYHDLVERGYRNVRRYDGGLTDWESAGLPLEGEWVHGEPA
jgi:rhodanese-related sulfurtransferase